MSYFAILELASQDNLSLIWKFKVNVVATVLLVLQN